MLTFLKKRMKKDVLCSFSYVLLVRNESDSKLRCEKGTMEELFLEKYVMKITKDFKNF